MLRVEDARELLLRNAPARRVESLPLDQALGLITAEDVVAPEALPNFPRSGMDGYALRAVDTAAATRESPVTLHLAGIIPAGHPMLDGLQPLSAASIMTGGVIPGGADAVIRMEEVRVTPSGVVIFRAVAAGENVAQVGEDVSEGQIVIRAGHRIRAAEINLLSAIGVDRVPVFAPPRVGILCTGDELVPSGVTPQLGQIRNSNGPGIAALVRAAGCDPVMMGLAHDAADVIAGAVSHALDCDLILTSGGVSVGDFDVVREALTVLGAQHLFWRVSMKPGTPVCAGIVQDRLIIGLSGNPAAAITNFDLLVRPLLDYLCGRPTLGLLETGGILDQPVLRRLPIARYLRARVYTDSEGVLRVDTDMAQRAGVLSSMVHANAYAYIPPNQGPLPAGHEVAVFLHTDADLLVALCRSKARA